MELFASVLAQIKFSNFHLYFILNDYIETITQLPNFTIHTTWYTLTAEILAMFLVAYWY
jgi:hypothetical protein